MKKVLNFIWKYKYLILIALVALIITLLIDSRRLQDQSREAIHEEGVDYNSIIPGKTSEKNLDAIFGEELSTEETGSQKVKEYESTSPVRTHQAIVEDEKVAFVKQIVSINDSLTANDLIKEHGTAQHMLYHQNDPNSSFFLYVYPEKGLAYLGHPDGTLLEIWYFPPSTIENFINSWASNYSFEKPPPIQ